MAKFNLNKPIMSVEGTPLTEDGREIKMGNTLASLLMQTGEGDTMRHWDLAVEVRKEKSELSPADVDYLKTFLRDKIVRIPHSFKRPILNEILEQEKKPEPDV